MNDGGTPKHRGKISFGSFHLNIGERLLMRDETPVELGGRALDILIALISNPDEVLSKRELMAQVWPDVTVDESSLRFHVSSLRKALGDGQDGARYIATIAGRGYRFVAPTHSPDEDAASERSARASRDANFLPPRVARMIGRGDGVNTLATKLISSRFVTIIGPGGVGKTTLALAVAHDMLEPFVGCVLFVDLGMLSDPGMVATSLASTLGISVRSSDPTPSLITFLRDKRILLVLDNCEHVVDSVAAITAQIYNSTPQVHLLTTSREALRADGEQVYKLEPLEVPPEDSSVTAASALTFPAAQLFIERAAASGASLELTDDDAALVAAICRKLDGVALAIELAAGRVEALGLQQTAALLDQRMTLLWQGRRTAPGRQRTLRATLDWSYELLSEFERQVLRCLAVFAGHFTAEGALSVISAQSADQAIVLSALESLVSKSMVVARQIDGAVHYRLLSTTRAYVLGVMLDDVDVTNLSRRHAQHCQRWLEANGAAGAPLSGAAARAPYLAGLNDVRAALEWCFGIEGDPRVGISLAAAACPVFLAMSLFSDCYRWAENAIAALHDEDRGGLYEMHLQAAFGLSLMFTRGSNESTHVALNRSLAIAGARGDPRSQLQLLAPLVMYHLRIGDFTTAIDLGKEASRLSKSISDPQTKALAHSITGISLTHTGDLQSARVELEEAQKREPLTHPQSTIYLGFDGHDLAGVFLARTLWLQGYPDQAKAHVHQTITDAIATDHPVTLSIALIWAISLYLWMGDSETAESLLDRFIARAKLHSLEPYLAAGRAYNGLLAVRRNNAMEGVAALRGAIADLHAARYELLTTTFHISLVQGLSALSRFRGAIELADETIRQLEANGDVSYMPELLRVKGNALRAMPGSEPRDVEACFMQALSWSRRQGALTSELSVAIDLATWQASSGRPDARSLLQPIYLRFTEGFDTPLLRHAERVLARLP